MIVRLILLMCIAGWSDAVAAQPFPTLPDGRVVLDIYGYKVALPTGPDSLRYIYIHPLRSAQSSFGDVWFSLGQALAEPEKARRAFDDEPENVTLRIGPSLSPRENRLVLEKWASDQVPMYTNVSLWITIRRAQYASANVQSSRSWAPLEATAPDEYGFFAREQLIPERRRERLDDVAYRLPAAQRLWPSPFDLIVFCRRAVYPARECQETIITDDRRVSITWLWLEASFPASYGPFKNFFPKSRWRELDARLREIALHVLIDQDPEKLR